MSKEQPTSYHELSHHNAEMEVGGRFAAPRPYVVGVEATTVNAPIPPSSIQWNDGTEPRLGTDIETVEDSRFVAHGGLINASAPVATCPYALAEGGCHLEHFEIGPCLCGATP